MGEERRGGDRVISRVGDMCSLLGKEKRKGDEVKNAGKWYEKERKEWDFMKDVRLSLAAWARGAGVSFWHLLTYINFRMGLFKTMNAVAWFLKAL